MTMTSSQTWYTMLEILLILFFHFWSSIAVINGPTSSPAPSSVSPPTLMSNATKLKVPSACSSLLSVDNVDTYLFGAPPAALHDCATALYEQISNSTALYTHQIAKKFHYCLQDPIADRNAAFDFSQNLTFMEQCFFETKGDLLDRLCGLGEINAYINSLIALAKDSGPKSPLIATTNCGIRKWSNGCEDGWASSLSSNAGDLNNRLVHDPTFVPARDRDPRPCCEGFFCPRGLTCMMPCPLGAYCPKATLNQLNGVCEPYGYQMAPGRNITCGGANFWADITTSSGIFCPAGFYCTGTTTHVSCDKGHYCRQGSTSQKRCFQLTSCDPNAATQNIKAYGVMLIVMLATILLLVYNCSDQVLHVREKRRANARETAVRHVKEHFNAIERWKMAVGAAKRFSRSLSRRARNKEETQVLAPPSFLQSDKGNRVEMLSRNGEISSQPTANTKPIIEINNTILPLEEDLYEPMEAPPMMSKVNGKDATVVKQRMPHTRSEIFRYAYREIEREKALQNKRMSWNELLEQAGQTGVRERLRLEITFIDLSLMLKGTGRKILCNVTGKLSPGRITAIMGPSGAGKTTFLNALAGKTYNSTTTGTVLINGKRESIQSYRKIIGFVPQDDIVHGSLTVEENLWFSAHYRLPVNMEKPEKVLIVERIIEALGLQHIRSSRVGTIEKRGISGGQRKRVNVGLEMVMEPSLLILDEPTSGLDSTSSQLVLKALRREAHIGVNVGLVVHQPSYGLFRMFDDVMLLAKGGRTIYLGPVDELENYFIKMGITVPERINPPDYFMDVLEGVAKPEGNAQFDPQILPIAWMRYNGYEISEDLQGTVLQIDASPQNMRLNKKTDHESSKLIKNSFVQDLWEEFRCYLVLYWDNFGSAFGRVEDLSRRRTPGILPQSKMIFKRVAKQRFRDSKVQAQDYLILLLAGACLGLLSSIKDSNLGTGGYPFTIIALSLLCMIAGLRTFSLDKLQYWRESASGINRVAYFLSKDLVDLFNTIIKPLVYLSMFYFFNDPRSTFVENYIVALALVYCVVGISYIFAITMENGAAQLWSVFLPIVSTLIATRSQTTGIVKFISYLTYASWAQEAFVIANAKRYSGVWLITRCVVLQAGKYQLKHWLLCIIMLLAYGLLARVIAISCLIFCNRDRQK